MFNLLVPLRLINPTCGSDWSGDNYQSAEYVHSVKQMGVNYHRLHPNYFFGVSSAVVTVRLIASSGNTLITQYATLFSHHLHISNKAIQFW
jgi:hypothetical protein